MPTPVYSPIIKQGRTFERTLTLKVNPTTPFNLTACQIISQLRKNPDAQEKVDFVIDIDPDTATGRFKWTMPYNVTATLELRDYVYDMVLIMANGKRFDILEGRPPVRKSITEIP